MTILKTAFPAAAVCLALLSGPALAQNAAAPKAVTAEQIDAAVQRAVAYLLSIQKDDGTWGYYGDPNSKDRSESGYFEHGLDVCAMMGLAYGEADLKDEKMKKGLKVLLEAKIDKNYVHAVRTIALAKLYPRLDRETQELALKVLKEDVEWTLKAQHAEGDWNYSGTGMGELSNTQMALLGLYEASTIFKELPNDVWQKAMDRYLKIQKPDGGWNYGHRSEIHASKPPYGSMTAAAVASLMIARDKLYGATGCPCKGGKSQRRGNDLLDKAIDSGIQWMIKNFKTDDNPGRGGYLDYWFFSCERVGLASGMKYFGTYDWYREFASVLLARQNPNGSWGHISDTALAIAFLVKGRNPILFNKIQFDGQWNNHPRDIANLASYLGKQKEQGIQWQVINLDVPVTEWHDAPIIYFSAETAVPFTEEQKKKLREYTDTGGTILFEASCGSRAAMTAWELVCKEVWPEFELKVLDKDHPLWTADVPVRGRQPVLFGLNDGVRTFMFYSKTDLSCAWNTMGVTANPAVFDLGGNLWMYATDKGKLRSRLASGTGTKYAATTPAAGQRKEIKVARIRHGGEWYLAKNYHPWQVLAADLQAKAGVTLTEVEPLAAGAAVPDGVHALYYSGRTNSALPAGSGAWLKKFVDGGGFLVAEAVLGNKDFEESLKATLQEAGLRLRLLPKEHALLTGQLGDGASGYAVPMAGYSVHARQERIGKPEPTLFGIMDGEKLVGVYSPLDILFSQTYSKAFGIRGYEAEDARALAMNIALYLTRQAP